MASAGWVNDSSLSSPRTPNAPRIRPSRTCFCGMVGGASVIVSRRAPVAPGRSGSGLAGLLVEVRDLVGHLRALSHPVLHALDVQLDLLLVARGHRVVEADALDVAA